jgi:hypothetical protein
MLTIFTIVLNGEPFIERHLPVFRQLTIPWEWHIVEGVAAPANCTAWCREMPDKWHRDYVSIDGTHEYLRSINCDNVHARWRHAPWFGGKVEMVATALQATDDGVVMQIDADEVWQAWQLERIHAMLIDQPPATTARFACRYWVGPNKILTSSKGWARGDLEWFRAWRWGSGVAFERHEPPIVKGFGRVVSVESTESMGLVFDHFAYVTPQQIAMKEDYYGYEGLVAAWHRLQRTAGAVKLQEFFPWAVGATADDLDRLRVPS